MENAPRQMHMKGYVTTHDSIAGRSARDLEQALGFQIGSLNAGYHVYELSGAVALGEFEWKDRTSYSDGWHFDPTIQEYVQRPDELRAHLGKANGWDEAATDRKIEQFMRQQCLMLNQRSGPSRIVKIVARGKIAGFPDAPYRNIRQWKLTVPKLFALAK
jgi:hypothetical protein